MKYLIDTCVVSDFVKGESGVVGRLLSLAPDDIAVSVISRMEVEYGLAINPERAKRLRRPLESFFQSVHQLPMTVEDALSAASIRSELKRIGRPIGPYDVLLAGTALQRDLTFVTSNTGEFERIRDLHIENWRKT